MLVKVVLKSADETGAGMSRAGFCVTLGDPVDVAGPFDVNALPPNYSHQTGTA